MRALCSACTASTLQHSPPHTSRRSLRKRSMIGVALIGATVLVFIFAMMYFKHRAAVSWDNVEAWISLRHASVKTISTRELNEIMIANRGDPVKKPLLLFDIRDASEFAASRIPGARHVAPLTVVDFAERELEKLDRSQPIVVYCALGVRSAAAAEQLQMLGFTNVRNLQGSIFQWANEDRPLEGGTRVHPYDATWGQLLRADLRSE
jgi:rhodanese-related sulfurtransferase